MNWRSVFRNIEVPFVTQSALSFPRMWLLVLKYIAANILKKEQRIKDIIFWQV
jgi:hypothetical protein